MKFIFALIFTLVPLSLAGNPLLTNGKIDKIIAGQTTLLNARWDEAYRIYSEMIHDNTNDPTGYLYTAVVMQSEMVAGEESFEKERFFGLLDTTRILAEKILENCTPRDSALCYLFIGHQYAYRAVWETRFGSSISAISFGFKAKGQYHKGIDADSTLTDLYLGLGTYHYWKTVKAGVLKLTGILKNDREKGIREIILAIDSSLFSREAARSAFLWVLINEEEYNEAIALAKEMFRFYPEGNFFLWPMAESYYKMKEYDKAAQKYDELLQRLKGEPGNYYNIVEAVYYLYNCYDKIDRDDKAGEVIKYFNSIKDEIPKQTERRQKGKISFLKRKQ